MMKIPKNSIFISYRRDDSADISGRIYDWLVREFGKENVFKDVDSIPLGIDFKEYLIEIVSQCEVLLAVIGRQWLTISDGKKKPRLKNPEDFVNIEIAAALERKIPVIPLLVQDTTMPGEGDLPENLKKLAYRNGMTIKRDPDFRADIERLIRGIKGHLDSGNSQQRIPEKKEKKEIYGLIESLWESCKYDHRGEWILDMASDRWVNLSVSEQQRYAKAYQTGYARAKGLEIEKTISGIAVRLVPPGRFWMGSPQKEIDLVKSRDNATYFDTETSHRVIVSKAYYIGKYEVTKAQWKAVMGESIQPYFKNSPSDAPMESISWDDCQSFCQKTGFQLPTEAQWEYACRSGVYGMSYIGDFEIKGWNNAPGLDAIAWYGGNSGVSYEGGYDSSGWSEKQYDHKRAGTQSVGKKLPNSFGLYDMLGNVWEWCQDKGNWNSKVETDTYIDNIVDPQCRNGSSCLFRGGAWYDYARYARSGNRYSNSPSFRDYNLGFRVFSPAP